MHCAISANDRADQMTTPIEYLNLDDLIELTILLLGEPPPIRDMGLLGSAAARPQTTAFGEDAYPDLWTKSAALLQSVLKNHAFIDGNKRLGWLATAVFLELNGQTPLNLPNEVVYELVYTVAAGELAVDEIASLIRAAVEDM